MFTYTVKDPRNGKSITKTFASEKGAVMFDWAYNPATRSNDIASVSFFKSVAAADKAASRRVDEDVIVRAL